jgi:hypothetical protein
MYNILSENSEGEEQGVLRRIYDVSFTPNVSVCSI